MFWISILGLILGIILGMLLKIPIPAIYAKYLGLVILAVFDTLLGGLRAHFEHNFDVSVFLSGLFFNGLAAGVLSYIGDRIGVEIYLAVIFVFGTRIFQNLAILRRHILAQIRVKNK